MPIRSKAENTEASTIGADAGVPDAMNRDTMVPDDHLLEEDGWIFRERPGVPVECVRRSRDASLAGMTQPNQIRHNYPSA